MSLNNIFASLKPACKLVPPEAEPKSVLSKSVLEKFLNTVASLYAVSFSPLFPEKATNAILAVGIFSSNVLAKSLAPCTALSHLLSETVLYLSQYFLPNQSYSYLTHSSVSVSVLAILPDLSNTTTAYTGFLLSVLVLTSFPSILKSILYLPSVSVLLTVLVTFIPPSVSMDPTLTVALLPLFVTLLLIPISPFIGSLSVISLANTLIGVIKSDIIIATSTNILVNFFKPFFILNPP